MENNECPDQVSFIEMNECGDKESLNERYQNEPSLINNAVQFELYKTCKFVPISLQININQKTKRKY